MSGRYVLSIHDMNRRKIGELYDSDAQFEGEARDVVISKEKNGWKEVRFGMDRFQQDGQRNPRGDYIRNEFQIRLIENGKADWYTIVQPADIHDGFRSTYEVVCEHVSGALKTRNLFGYFDETNGIADCRTLCERALAGTGWTLAHCDTFYESDGVTEKIRSYKCDEKTGAWQMLQGICELFYAYPEFDGDAMTVTIRARKNFNGLMEVTFGKNTEHIERKLDSSGIVTRLYVQGDYTDDGYVGIDDAKDNETHLNFICNFDYYKEIGMFMPSHEAALEKYLQTKSAGAEEILAQTQEKLKLETEFGNTISTYGVVLMKVEGGVLSEPILLNGAVPADADIKAGDKIVAVQMDGEKCTGYEYVDFESIDALPAATIYIGRFLTTINGSLMTAENFADTAQSTAAGLDDPAAGEDLLKKAEEYREKAREYMAQGILIAEEIQATEKQIASLNSDVSEAEDVFAAEMGMMLKEGYWSDDKYITGQEDALYSDALEISRQMAYPQAEWVADIRDISWKEGYEGEALRLNQLLRIYDETTGLKAMAFIDKQEIHPRREWDNKITISTDELGLAGKSLDSILTRVTDMAEMLRRKASIYDRSEAISGSGKVAAQMLEGMIDISKNQILSVGSNWYTDEKGNLVFVALDGRSAMMLTGMGFMIANEKTDEGKWNWRTFGTGDGFTADAIVTGFLSAERILAGSITADHLRSDVGASLDLSSNKSIVSTVREEISHTEIGGRNLLKGTNRRWEIQDDADVFVEKFVLDTDIRLEEMIGRQYTMSVYVAAPGEWESVNGDAQFGVYALVTWGDGDGSIVQRLFDQAGIGDNEGGRVAKTETLVPPDGYSVLESIEFFAVSTVRPAAGNLQSWVLALPKLESGAIATDWTAAPGDTSDSIGQSEKGLRDEISDSQERFNEKLAQYMKTGDADVMISETVATQTKELFEWRVKTDNALEYTDGKIKQLETHMSFGKDGQVIGSSDSDLTLHMTNDRISFKLKGLGEVAYITDNKLYITNAEITNSQRIGRFVWEPQTNGNMSLVYEG